MKNEKHQIHEERIWEKGIIIGYKQNWPSVCLNRILDNTIEMKHLYEKTKFIKLSENKRRVGSYLSIYVYLGKQTPNSPLGIYSSGFKESNIQNIAELCKYNHFAC